MCVRCVVNWVPEQCVVETEGRGIGLMEYLRCRRVQCLGAGVLSPIFTRA